MSSLPPTVRPDRTTTRPSTRGSRSCSARCSGPTPTRRCASCAPAGSTRRRSPRRRGRPAAVPARPRAGPADAVDAERRPGQHGRLARRRAPGRRRRGRPVDLAGAAARRHRGAVGRRALARRRHRPAAVGREEPGVEPVRVGRAHAPRVERARRPGRRVRRGRARHGPARPAPRGHGDDTSALPGVGFTLPGLPAGALGLPAGDPAALMRRLGSAVFGMQVGQAAGTLSREVFGATDVGLPLLDRPATVLLPTNVAAFAEGLDAPAEEVRLFLALREAAHARLFTHVSWLRGHLRGLVDAYARGITIDLSALESQLADVDLADTDALQRALSGGVFGLQSTPEQQTTLARLETTLALVEGWVDEVTAVAALPTCPTPSRCARCCAVVVRRAGPRSTRSRRSSASSCAPALARRGRPVGAHRGAVRRRCARRRGTTPTCCPTGPTSTTRPATRGGAPRPARRRRTSTARSRRSSAPRRVRRTPDRRARAPTRVAPRLPTRRRTARPQTDRRTTVDGRRGRPGRGAALTWSPPGQLAVSAGGAVVPAAPSRGSTSASSGSSPRPARTTRPPGTPRPLRARVGVEQLPEPRAVTGVEQVRELVQEHVVEHPGRHPRTRVEMRIVPSMSVHEPHRRSWFPPTARSWAARGRPGTCPTARGRGAPAPRPTAAAGARSRRGGRACAGPTRAPARA